MDSLKQNKLWLSIVTIAAGFLFVLAPRFVTGFIGYVLGVLLIVLSVFEIIAFFKAGRHGVGFLAYRGLFIGVVASVLGIMLLIDPASFMRTVSVVIGIAIIVDSIYKSMQAWSMRGVVGSNWVLSFVFALICATAGLVLIVCSGFGSRTIVVLLGINLMVNGVMGIVGNVAGQKN